MEKIILLIIVFIIIRLTPCKYLKTSSIKQVSSEQIDLSNPTKSLLINNIERFEITRNERNQIYYLLKTITDIFDSHNVIYWIDGGTILGAVRHGCIIPWDDDVDICILESDYDKLEEIAEQVLPLGFEIIRHWDLYKFRFAGREYPFVDIFLNVKDGSRYTLNSEKMLAYWPNEYFEFNELFPLKKYKFGDHYYSGPNYPLDYLDRMYLLWEFLGIQSYDHKAKKKIKTTVLLDPSNTDLSLKPYYYVKPSEDISKVFDEKFNTNVIVNATKDKISKLKIKLEEENF